MKKTIKLIDLLNKIANGEDIPDKIKFLDSEYQKYKEITDDGTEEITYDYKRIYDDDGNYELMFQDTILKITSLLNDEVEILEEEKLPEKLEEIGKIDYNLEFIDYKNIEVLKDYLNKDIQAILNELDLIVENQNQLIDYLESKEKGE